MLRLLFVVADLGLTVFLCYRTYKHGHDAGYAAARAKFEPKHGPHGRFVKK